MKYVNDVVVFHLRMARKGRNMLWTERIKVTPINSQLRSLVYLRGIRKETVVQAACSNFVSRGERCEVLACFHVIVKMNRYSLEERVFIVKTYWIPGKSKVKLSL
jgi:hypothetical protein